MFYFEVSSKLFNQHTPPHSRPNLMKLVYLEWLDAISNAQWFTKDQAEEWGEKSQWMIKEAGWLIKETKKYVVIATSYKPEDEWTDEQFCNMHKIPKSWIRKYQILKNIRSMNI